MGTGLLSSIFGDTNVDELGAESFYECIACGSTFWEWSTACPECGELVVRIVEPCAHCA